MSQGDETIYDRIGGREGIAKIANDIMQLHGANTVLIRRYGHAKKNSEELGRLLTESYVRWLAAASLIPGCRWPRLIRA